VLQSIPFHSNINLSQSNTFSHVAMDAYSSQSVNIQEIFNAYQYRIYKLDFCFNNFHIFRFSRSGKREVDVNCFVSKHSSDYSALFLLRSLGTTRHQCVITYEVLPVSPPWSNSEMKKNSRYYIACRIIKTNENRSTRVFHICCNLFLSSKHELC